MQGVRTGDYSCKRREDGCEARNPKPRRFCPACTRAMHEVGSLVNRLNNPPPQPYTPRVVKVIHD